MNEASLKNLKPYNKATAKLNGRKGGIKSVEAKKKKKSLRECAIMFCDLECDEAMKDRLRYYGVDEELFTNGMAIICGLYASAIRGNVGAIRLLLELVGEIKANNNVITVTNTTTVNPYANLTEDELRRLASGE